MCRDRADLLNDRVAITSGTRVGEQRADRRRSVSIRRGRLRIDQRERAERQADRVPVGGIFVDRGEVLNEWQMAHANRHGSKWSSENVPRFRALARSASCVAQERAQCRIGVLRMSVLWSHFREELAQNSVYLFPRRAHGMVWCLLTQSGGCALVLPSESCSHGLAHHRPIPRIVPHNSGGSMHHEATMRMMRPILITWCRRRAAHGEPRERQHTPSLWTLLFSARSLATLDPNAI